MGLFDINIFDDGPDVPSTIDDRKDISEVMQPEVRDDVPGFEGQDVVVFGKPLEIGQVLDYEQGDNPFDAQGNCGLVSTSNFLNLCGIKAADENFITGYAIVHGECDYSEDLPPDIRGGTNATNVQSILSDFGIDSEVVYSSDANGDIESIATRLEEGYVGVMSVNAGYLWDDPNYIQGGTNNHRVTLTGTVRDTDGNLIGLTICDSGSNEPCHVVPIEQLQDCYSDISGANVVFSAEPIRQQLV